MAYRVFLKKNIKNRKKKHNGFHLPSELAKVHQSPNLKSEYCPQFLFLSSRRLFRRELTNYQEVLLWPPGVE